MVVQSPQSALYGSLQFVGSAIDGLVQVRCLVSNGCGLATLNASFHHAAFVVLAALMSVFIAEVNFHPCDVLSEAAQSAFNDTLDVICEFLSAFYITVRIDLDLHLVHRPLLLLKIDRLRLVPSASAPAQRSSVGLALVGFGSSANA
jgi:hypothetical protein